MWQDNRQAWDLEPDGSYAQRRPSGQEAELATHRVLVESYRETGRATGEFRCRVVTVSCERTARSRAPSSQAIVRLVRHPAASANFFSSSSCSGVSFSGI